MENEDSASMSFDESDSDASSLKGYPLCGSAALSDCSDIDSDDLDHFSVAPMCLNLQRDISAATSLYGDESCFVQNQVDDAVTLHLLLDARFLSSRVATAWGIDTTVPIILSIRDLSATCYLTPQTNVLVWQEIVHHEDPSRKLVNNCGVLPQIMFIAREFIRKRSNLNRDVANLDSPSRSASFMNENVLAVERKKASFYAESRASSGLFVDLIEYLKFRMGWLNEVCPLCDQGHMFGSPMLKPAVCRRELCAFAFSKLGLMADSVDGVASMAEVVDLLVAMLRSATLSTRCKDVVVPFPLVYDSANLERPVISNAEEHMELVKNIVSTIKMSSLVEERADKRSNNHPLALPLVSWVVNSNRSHLVKLDSDNGKHIACLETKHQFLLLSAPPEVEATFSALKQEHGSIWAFHGSRTENWHSILRNGLKNMSGTKGQLNGASYGPGVYVSSSSQMSLGYCCNYNYHVSHPSTSVATVGGNQDVELLDGFFCMAVVEIIKGKEIRHNLNIWTVTDESAVVTRFFIVYPPGSMRSVSVMSTSEDFINQVEAAMRAF